MQCQIKTINSILQWKLLSLITFVRLLNCEVRIMSRLIDSIVYQNTWWFSMSVHVLRFSWPLVVTEGKSVTIVMYKYLIMYMYIWWICCIYIYISIFNTIPFLSIKMTLHYRYYKISYLCIKQPLNYANVFYRLNLFKYWLLKSFSTFHGYSV